MVRNPNQGDEQTTKISVRLKDSVKQELNRIAYAKSSPGDQVKVSQVVREAIHEYVELEDVSDPRSMKKGGMSDFDSAKLSDTDDSLPESEGSV